MFLHVNCCINLFSSHDTAATEIYTLSLHDALPIYDATAAAMALAMSRSGDTVSAPATESAVFGMPYTVDVASSWITAQAPARRMARSPSLPSLPIPVSTTPMAERPNVVATVPNSRSADGRMPWSGGSSRMMRYGAPSEPNEMPRCRPPGAI